MAHRVPTAFDFQTFYLVIWGFWRAAGLMLVGMGLYKLGFFNARALSRLHATFVGVALLVGLPLVGYGVRWNFANEWGPLSFFCGFQFNYWGSLLVSLGWVGMVAILPLRSCDRIRLHQHGAKKLRGNSFSKRH